MQQIKIRLSRHAQQALLCKITNEQANENPLDPSGIPYDDIFAELFTCTGGGEIHLVSEATVQWLVAKLDWLVR